MNEQQQLQLLARDIFNLKKELAEDARQSILDSARSEAKRTAMKAFNPDNDIVISRGELEALNSLKSNSDVLSTIAKQVEQLHKLQTGELFNPDKAKKKLTPKEKRELDNKESEARIQKMRNRLNLKALGNL